MRSVVFASSLAAASSLKIIIGQCVAVVEELAKYPIFAYVYYSEACIEGIQLKMKEAFVSEKALQISHA